MYYWDGQKLLKWVEREIHMNCTIQDVELEEMNWIYYWDWQKLLKWVERENQMNCMIQEVELEEMN